jgi:8-oxo-dGTP pyrophosphatase MutT (NUDIX family)
VDFNPFISKLKQNLKGPLPGRDAHLKLMNENRFRSKIQPNDFTRQSAVLLVFYPYQSGVFLPLILRPPYDGTHGGQMAFPGGRMEEEDESLHRTALREAQEEIGIKAIDVVVLGTLTQIFIPQSNFWVLPVVGYLDYRPDFFPDPREVQSIVEVDIDDLLTDNNIQTREMNLRGMKFDTPGYAVNDQWIWGATAIITSELVELFRK